MGRVPNRQFLYSLTLVVLVSFVHSSISFLDKSTQLGNAAPARLSVSSSSYASFYLDVPSIVNNFSIQYSNPKHQNQIVSVYVNNYLSPAIQKFETNDKNVFISSLHQFNLSSNTPVTVENPPIGRWYFLVKSTSDINDATFQVSFNYCPNGNITKNCNVLPQLIGWNVSTSAKISDDSLQVWVAELNEDTDFITFTATATINSTSDEIKGPTFLVRAGGIADLNSSLTDGFFCDMWHSSGNFEYHCTQDFTSPRRGFWYIVLYPFNSTTEWDITFTLTSSPLYVNLIPLTGLNHVIYTGNDSISNAVLYFDLEETNQFDMLTICPEHSDQKNPTAMVVMASYNYIPTEGNNDCFIFSGLDSHRGAGFVITEPLPGRYFFKVGGITQKDVFKCKMHINKLGKCESHHQEHENRIVVYLLFVACVVVIVTFVVLFAGFKLGWWQKLRARFSGEDSYDPLFTDSHTNAGTELKARNYSTLHENL